MAYVGSQQLNINSSQLSPATKKAFDQLITNINNVFMRINKTLSSITPLEYEELRELVKQSTIFMKNIHKELQLKCEIPKILLSIDEQSVPALPKNDTVC